MWFLTVDPLMRIFVFIAKFSERNCWRTSPVASSCVCISPLAVMTLVGLHDFVKVSISASFKSFMLIMRIDVPESTTNSFLKFQELMQAGTCFPKVRRMLFWFSPLILTLLPASTLLRGHLALATLSLPEQTTGCPVPSCKSYFFSIATALLSSFVFRPFARLFINLATCTRALFTKSALLVL